VIHAGRPARLGQDDPRRQIALRLKEQGRRSLLVAADVYRPAAIEQLKTLGRQLDLPVYSEERANPVEIAKHGVAEAQRLGIPIVIVDTAGRLQIDEALMVELEKIKAAVKPKEILFVADAMTGQEATNVAKGFNAQLGDHGRHPDQDGRRRARRRGALDFRDDRRADQVRRRRRKVVGARDRSIPIAWPRASWAWATC
jgi:hypothetical protein